MTFLKSWLIASLKLFVCNLVAAIAIGVTGLFLAVFQMEIPTIFPKEWINASIWIIVCSIMIFLLFLFDRNKKEGVAFKCIISPAKCNACLLIYALGFLIIMCPWMFLEMINGRGSGNFGFAIAYCPSAIIGTIIGGFVMRSFAKPDLPAETT